MSRRSPGHSCSASSLGCPTQLQVASAAPGVIYVPSPPQEGVGSSDPIIVGGVLATTIGSAREFMRRFFRLKRERLAGLARPSRPSTPLLGRLQRQGIQRRLCQSSYCDGAVANTAKLVLVFLLNLFSAPDQQPRAKDISRPSAFPLIGLLFDAPSRLV